MTITTGFCSNTSSSRMALIWWLWWACTGAWMMDSARAFSILSWEGCWSSRKFTDSYVELQMVSSFVALPPMRNDTVSTGSLHRQHHSDEDQEHHCPKRTTVAPQSTTSSRRTAQRMVLPGTPFFAMFEDQQATTTNSQPEETLSFDEQETPSNAKEEYHSDTETRPINDSPSSEPCLPQIGASAVENDTSTTDSSSALALPETKPKPEPTLYEILGASPTASRQDLKRAYVQRARLTHPDSRRNNKHLKRLAPSSSTSTSDLVLHPSSASSAKHNHHPDPSQPKHLPSSSNNHIKVPPGLPPAQEDDHEDGDLPDFGTVAAAYKVLSDPKTRQRYDRTLQAQQFTNTVIDWMDGMARVLLDDLFAAQRNKENNVDKQKDQQQQSTQQSTEQEPQYSTEQELDTKYMSSDTQEESGSDEIRSPHHSEHNDDDATHRGDLMSSAKDSILGLSSLLTNAAIKKRVTEDDLLDLTNATDDSDKDIYNEIIHQHTEKPIPSVDQSTPAKKEDDGKHFHSVNDLNATLSHDEATGNNLHIDSNEAAEERKEEKTDLASSFSVDETKASASSREMFASNEKQASNKALEIPFHEFTNNREPLQNKARELKERAEEERMKIEKLRKRLLRKAAESSPPASGQTQPTSTNFPSETKVRQSAAFFRDSMDEDDDDVSVARLILFTAQQASSILDTLQTAATHSAKQHEEEHLAKSTNPDQTKPLFYWHQALGWRHLQQSIELLEAHEAKWIEAQQTRREADLILEDCKERLVYIERKYKLAVEVYGHHHEDKGTKDKKPKHFFSRNDDHKPVTPSVLATAAQHDLYETQSALEEAKKDVRKAQFRLQKSSTLVKVQEVAWFKQVYIVQQGLERKRQVLATAASARAKGASKTRQGNSDSKSRLSSVVNSKEISQLLSSEPAAKASTNQDDASSQTIVLTETLDRIQTLATELEARAEELQQRADALMAWGSAQVATDQSMEDLDWL